MLNLTKSTKGKVIKVTPLTLKMGQKNLVDAPSLLVEFMVDNHVLDQLDHSGRLRELLFEPPGTDSESNKRKTKELPGVEPDTDRPLISLVGQKMGAISWAGEQTGCKFTVILGTGRDNSNIALDGCTVKKLELTPVEPGATKVRMTINGAAADAMDATTYGRVMMLKRRDITFTLEPPKVDQMGLLGTGNEAGSGGTGSGKAGGTVTPIKALTDAVLKDPVVAA